MRHPFLVVVFTALAWADVAEADGASERRSEAKDLDGPGNEVSVSFELASGSDEAAFYVIGPEPAPQKRATELCSTPCETRVEEGVQWIGVGPSGEIYPFGTARHKFEGPTEVRGGYDSRIGLRVAGGLVISVLGVGGLSMSVVGLLNRSKPLLIAGLGTAALGNTAGVIMVTRDDTIDITITPLTSRSAAGLSVRGKF